MLRDKRDRLSPAQVNGHQLAKLAGVSVLSRDHYVRLLTAPKWDGQRWTALAQVDSGIAIVEVSLYRREE